MELEHLKTKTKGRSCAACLHSPSFFFVLFLAKEIRPVTPSFSQVDVAIMLARHANKLSFSKARSVRFLSACSGGENWIVSPAAGVLLAGNPSIDVKSLARKCAGHSPGSGKVVITKVRGATTLLDRLHQGHPSNIDQIFCLSDFVPCLLCRVMCW